jgi:hypothetical protein
MSGKRAKNRHGAEIALVGKRLRRYVVDSTQNFGGMVV